MIIKKCPTCKKEYYIKQSRKNTAKFCSRSCVRSTEESKRKIGDASRGKKHTKEWIKQASMDKLNQKNPMWKGKNAKLPAIHIWILKRKPKPKICVGCRKSPPKDLANISQKYKRDIKDFEWLCRKCHMKKDGRLEKFINYKKP